MFLTKSEYKKLSVGQESGDEVKLSPVISPASLTRKDLVTNPDGSQVDVEDNTLLSVLDKAHIIANMRNRFNRDCIYTFTASVLLSVNPWKQIPGLYSDQMQMLYTNKSLHSLPPHPYAIADTAYRYFQGDSKSQVLVVSGESGSGKTETAKVVISFLATHRERRHLHKQLAGQSIDDSGITDNGVHEKVISATPILEAFGNASTIRNKNSSRFGKYHRLLYDRAGTLIGAEIKPLLLESSRVTGISYHERNFHIFYLMLAGMPDLELRSKYGIAKDEVFPIIASGMRRDEARTREDEEKFHELLAAFDTVGYTQEERDRIFATVSGLLVLSQVLFSEQEEETKDEEGKRTKLVEIANEDVLDKAAVLLGFDRTQLFKVLLNKTVKVTNRTSAYSVPRSLSQVEATRATLIRTVYKRLFEHIVDRINELVAASQGCESPSRSKSLPNDLHIGVLDIFGFENLEKNSFEQLCINLTNEKLQQFFIRKVLEAEVRIYQAEGIHSSSTDVSKLPLPDCSETLGCIKGALELLDDHCLRMTRNMPTDEEKYCTQVHRQFYADRSDSKLQPPKFAKATRGKDGGKVAARAKTVDGFIIRHYAGEVLYTVTGWLEKNNERMSPEMECLVRDSRDRRSSEDGQLTSAGSLVAQLTDAEACSYACEKFKSVRSKFMAELENVLAMLDKCAVHYVRCFNPNNGQKARDFSSKYVEDQVVQCGTVELVNVMHHGFPNRQPLSLIAEKFQHLLPYDFRQLNHRDLTSVIMSAFEVPPSEYAIGFTTLFLKADQVRLLEQLRGVGELPSERVLSTIRKQVVAKKLKRCFEVVKLVVWLPRWMKQLKRKNLFSHGAKLAVTIAFILPRARPWLVTVRERIRIRREEEERQRLEDERIRREAEEERQRLEEEEERLRKEAEEERQRLEEEERLRKEKEERMKAEEEMIKRQEETDRSFKHEQVMDSEDDNPLALIAAPKGGKTAGKVVTPMTSTVPQLPGKAMRENMTQPNVPAAPWVGKTSASLGTNSLAKLPPVTAMMVNNITLFGVPKLNSLLLYDGKRVMPVTTNENSVAEASRSGRRSSMGSIMPSLLPMTIRGASISAICQHPCKPEVFATADSDEVGAVTIWRAGKGGVESRFKIQLGQSGDDSTNPMSASILKLCFIAPDSLNTNSPVYEEDKHLLAILVECTGVDGTNQFVVIVEASINNKGGNTRASVSSSRRTSVSGAGGDPEFRVHKVEPIPPSQFMSNLNRKIAFLKTSASGRIVAVGGKGLLMMFAVGRDADGTLCVDFLADQSFFPQIQTTTFLSLISLYHFDPSLPAEPDAYWEEQLLVSTADGQMLRFPIIVTSATCALDIMGCGRIRECTASLAPKRLTSLVKKNDDAYYSITADGCIDHWVWVDRRPYRDVDASIALVAEHSKAMFSTAALLSREIVCFDAHAGKVVAFDPSDPDRLNPRLLYQFNSQGILGGF